MEMKTHLAILGQVDLERLRVVLKTQRRHCEQNILAIDRLALFLVTFL